jgi:peptidoglycan/LPS O-acetylase OafA/YrhL
VGNATAESARQPGSPASQHLSYLDGLRACAALFVVTHHILQTAEHTGKPLRGALRALAPFHYGHFAVSLFIVISGFSLMLPVVRADLTLRGGALSFFGRRAKRILPPYYLSMAASLVLIAVGVKDIGEGEVTRVGVLSHALLIHNLFPSAFHQINIAFWSIAVEWQIYFLFPVLIFAWRRIGAVSSTAAAIVASFVVAYGVRHTFLNGMTLHYVGLFAIGMLAAAIGTSNDPRFSRIRERVPWAAVGLVTLAGLIFVCCSLQFPPLRECDLAVAILAVVVLVLPLRGSARTLGLVLGWRPLTFFGHFAFSIYLMHVPILRLVEWSGMIKPSSDTNVLFVRLFFCGMPLVLIGGYAFYWACERPFLRTTPQATRVLPVEREAIRTPSSPSL